MTASDWLLVSSSGKRVRVSGGLLRALLEALSMPAGSQAQRRQR